MSVAVTLRGRLGNNCFQYVIGRRIARHLDLALDCHPHRHPENHPSGQIALRGPATLDTLTQYFPNAPLAVPGRRCLTPVQAFELSSDRTWNGQTIPIQAILDEPTPRHIRLHGYFQRSEYLAGCLGDVRHWLTPVGVSPPLALASTDVVVSIRRGLDFGLNGWILPLSYYDDALSECRSWGRVIVCGTCVDDTVKRHFAQYHAIYVEATPIEEFVLIMRAQRIVLSNSTFAWWAAVLSEAAQIFGPASVNGDGYAFSGYDAVALSLGDGRYRDIPVNHFESSTWSVRSHIVGATIMVTDREIVIGRAGLPSNRYRRDDPSVDVLEHLSRTQVSDASRLISLYSAAHVERTMKLLARDGLATIQHSYRTAS